MKRFLAFAVALAVTGCSGPAEEATEVSEAAEATQFAEDAKTVETEAKPAPEPRFYAEPRPVRIGFDGPDFDACGSYGEIQGLNPDGDNFLSVRAAPSVQGEELDRLTTGTGVSLCETAGSWIGVVYEQAGVAGVDCDTGSPVSDIREYDGPCRSGWVSQRFVQLIAG